VVTIVEIDGEIASQLAPAAADVVQLAREALSNVGRHARATTCRVTLRREAGAGLLEIDDDGSGFRAVQRPARPGSRQPGGSGDGHGRQGVGDIGSRRRHHGAGQLPL
jgi:signal transduction histidine kinase